MNSASFDLRRRLALALMVASGFAALGYQIVWTQQSALWLGHESAAVLAVVVAFFGGLALGALIFGGRVGRSASPGRWYAGCEAVIGLWSLALAVLLPLATGWLLDLIGPQPLPGWHWFVAFGGTFLLLLPATAATCGSAMCRTNMRNALGSNVQSASTQRINSPCVYCSPKLWADHLPPFGLVRTRQMAGPCRPSNTLAASAVPSFDPSSMTRTSKFG